MVKKKDKDSGDEDISAEDDRNARLKELFSAAKKKFGPDSLVFAKDFKYKDVHRISTGILPLDYALGGGLPVGRISMLYGHKSTSKSTNYLRAIGNAQRMCSTCWTRMDRGPCQCGEQRRVKALWLDVESVWDDSWAKKFVDLDDLVLAQPDTAEQAIDIGDAAIRSGAIDIVVVDSIASMTSAVEIEKTASELTVGLQARLVGQQMRKFVSGMNEMQHEMGRKPTVWLINQIRMKVGVMYGSPETTPGGMAVGFATSCEIRTSSGKYTMEHEGEGARPISVEMRAKVEKNKTSAAKMEAEWKMVLADTEVKKVGDIIDEHWALNMAVKAGLVDCASNRYTWKGESYHGASKLETKWMNDREDYEDLKTQLMTVLLAA